MIAFSDLARAAYCPRQLYYVRRDADPESRSATDAGRTDPDAADPRRPPADVHERIELAYRYAEHVDAPNEALRALPIDREPSAYRAALERLRDRPDWADLVEPDRTRAFLEGKDCHGIAYKVLVPPSEGTSSDRVDSALTAEGEPPPIPTIVSPGEPPESGVWEPQGVRAVAAAKALAWELEREVPRALVEYPAWGVVREVRLTVRKTAAYRRALRTVRSIDGPPPRVAEDAKCEPCDYREQCGTRTRSLASRLGL